MKVFIVTKEPFPNGLAATSRIKCYIKALLAANKQCELLIYSRTESTNSHRNICAEGDFEGIYYRYIGGTTQRKDKFIIQQLINVKDKLRLLRYLKENLRKDDIVFGYAAKDVFFINTLINVVHRSKGKYIRDLCELPYGTGQETLKAKLLRAYSLNFQFKKCDGIIAISSALYELARKYSPKTKVIIIPILVEYEKYNLPNNSQFAKFPFIFHAGSLQEQKDGILGMLKSFAIVARQIPSCRFISTGRLEKSPNANEIKTLITNESIEEKVFFLGYLDQHELNKYLSKAQAVIINKSVNQQNTYCFSNKLGEYMAAGKPVVITRVGEAINWLNSGVDSIIVEPNNHNQIAESLIKIINDEHFSRSLSINAKETCKKSFDFRVYSDLLKRFISQL